jgi:uncharacterized protein YqeY
MMDRLEKDINESLKCGDKFRLSVLKMVKAALLNKRIEVRHELDETEFIAVLRKEVKQRHDTAVIYRQVADDARALSEEKEITIIEEYLPAQMSDEDLRRTVSGVFEKLGSKTPIGLIIKATLEKTDGQADGGRIAAMAQSITAEEDR